MKIQARDVNFDLTGDIPKHWNDNDPVKTHFFNTLSVVLPAYEQFFIRTMIKNIGAITDLVLKDEAKGFCAQEGTHAAEHRKLNALLVRQGYTAVPKFEKLQQNILKFIQKRFSNRAQLAMATGGEHVTSFMCHEFLSDKARWSYNSHPTMDAIFRWHSLEELEHKNVCFDVYQTIVGGRWFRILGYIGFWIPTLLMLTLIQTYLLYKDGLLFKPRTWTNYFSFMFGRKGNFWRLVQESVRFSRKGFHPSQIDDSHLIEESVYAFSRNDFASARAPELV